MALEGATALEGRRHDQHVEVRLILYAAVPASKARTRCSLPALARNVGAQPTAECYAAGEAGGCSGLAVAGQLTIRW